MRFFFLVIGLLVGTNVYSQSDVLAKNYFNRGDFDKALNLYKQLHEKTPHRNDYFVYYIKCLQQLESLDEAEKLLLEKVQQPYFNKTLYIELGRNYLLQKKQTQADEYFQKAVETISQNPKSTYNIAKCFEDYILLDWAILAYETGMQLDETLDYSSSLARVYGEQGDFEKMINAYLNIIEKNSGMLISVQRNLSRYITDNPENETNRLLRRLLLSRNQNNPQPYYNHLLSWLFVQQKQYDRAFIQEKALFRLSGEGIEQITDIAMMAFEGQEYETAGEILQFISENAPSEPYKVKALQYLLQIKAVTTKPARYDEVENEYVRLIEQYDKTIQLFDIHVDYNRFLALKANRKEDAVANLKKLLERNLSRLQEARVLMELADILVFEEKFNEALIYYSQVQNKVKNDPLAQEARYKVAQTSFFKGDFPWAQTQLDVLKKSTSQLIANDAMELSLLISDNSYEDSTHTALKKYAQAVLYELQEKPTEAIAVLDEILRQHQGKSIEDEALLLQARLYEKTEQYHQAIHNYKNIIQNHPEDILADNALFYLAELYHKTLHEPNQARSYYEQIVFNHPDSIYFVEARKQYRVLRGDNL